MSKKTKFTFLLSILVVAALLVACQGAAPNSYEDANSSEPASEQAGEPTFNEGADSAGVEHVAAPQQRIVIMSGEMTVETYDPAEIVGYITQLADEYRGYVVKSSLENQVVEDKEVTYGSITIRVPAQQLSDVIADIERQALTVTAKFVSGDDVTADYVDLESRLRNLEEAATQLQEIMDKSTDTEAVLKVYQELEKVNEEAEVIRGQIKYYDEASSMSSLSVEVNPVIENPPEPTPTPAWSFGATFEESGERLSFSFQRWVKSVIQFVVYRLPMFILRAGPWLLGFFLVGRWVLRKAGFTLPKANKKEVD